MSNRLFILENMDMLESLVTPVMNRNLIFPLLFFMFA